MTVCRIDGCDAPAGVAWSAATLGVDFDGSQALFELQRIVCAAGHWWTHTTDGIRDPFPTEGATL